MPRRGPATPRWCKASAGCRGASSTPWSTASPPACNATACSRRKASRSAAPTASSTRWCSSAGCARARRWRRCPPGATAEQLAGMVADSGARLLFADATVPALDAGVPRIALDASPGHPALDEWLPRRGREARARDRAAGVAVQHHLFLRDHRHAQGHRAAAFDALGPRGPRRGRRLRAAVGGPARDLAVLQHHAGVLLPGAVARRHRGAHAGTLRCGEPTCAWPNASAPPTRCWFRCSTSA